MKGEPRWIGLTALRHEDERRDSVVLGEIGQKGARANLSRPYLCPVCKGNRTRFELIFKMAQEVHKDPTSGITQFQSDELTTLTHRDGRLDLDVRCDKCGYVGTEKSFVKAAERDSHVPAGR